MTAEEKWEHITGQLNQLVELALSKGYLPQDLTEREKAFKVLNDSFAELYNKAEMSGQITRLDYVAEATMTSGVVGFLCNMRLGFSYDPRNASLEFKEVNLGMADNINIEYKAQGQYDLPEIGVVAARLLEAIDGECGVGSKQAKEQKDQRIRLYISSYQELFEEKGYFNTGPDGQPMVEEMKKAIEETFSPCMDPANDDEEVLQLALGIKATISETGEQFDFEFHFEYDPQIADIQMKALLVSEKNFSTVVKPKRNSSFPARDEIIRKIQEAKIAAARGTQPLKKKRKKRRGM